MGSFFKHEQNDLKGLCNLERWPYLFDECGIEVRFIWKRGQSQGDHSNGLIDDFASISSTEPKGDFDHSTLASEGGIMSLGISESESSLSDPGLGRTCL